MTINTPSSPISFNANLQYASGTKEKLATHIQESVQTPEGLQKAKNLSANLKTFQTIAKDVPNTAQDTITLSFSDNQDIEFNLEESQNKKFAGLSAGCEALLKHVFPARVLTAVTSLENSLPTENGFSLARFNEFVADGLGVSSKSKELKALYQGIEALASKQNDYSNPDLKVQFSHMEELDKFIANQVKLNDNLGPVRTLSTGIRNMVQAIKTIDNPDNSTLNIDFAKLNETSIPTFTLRYSQVHPKQDGIKPLPTQDFTLLDLDKPDIANKAKEFALDATGQTEKHKVLDAVMDLLGEIPEEKPSVEAAAKQIKVMINQLSRITPNGKPLSTISNKKDAVIIVQQGIIDRTKDFSIEKILHDARGNRTGFVQADVRGNGKDITVTNFMDVQGEQQAKTIVEDTILELADDIKTGKSDKWKAEFEVYR